MLWIYITLTILFAAMFVLSCFQKRDKLKALFDLGFINRIFGLLGTFGMCFVHAFNGMEMFWFPLCMTLSFYGFGSSTLINIAFFSIDRSKVDIPIFVLGALGTIGWIIISSICY